MSCKHIVNVIAMREGKKSQTSIGNIREIVGIMSEMVLDPYTLITLLKNGVNRQKKKTAQKRIKAAK